MQPITPPPTPREQRYALRVLRHSQGPSTPSPRTKERSKEEREQANIEKSMNEELELLRRLKPIALRAIEIEVRLIDKFFIL